MSLAWLPVTKPIATAKFQVVEPSCDCIFKKIRQIPQLYSTILSSKSKESGPHNKIMTFGYSI